MLLGLFRIPVTLRPKHAALRAPQGFAPTGMRELIHPGGGQIGDQSGPIG